MERTQARSFIYVSSQGIRWIGIRIVKRSQIIQKRSEILQNGQIRSDLLQSPGMFALIW
jgi:hypothetical protein